MKDVNKQTSSSGLKEPFWNKRSRREGCEAPVRMKVLTGCSAGHGVALSHRNSTSGGKNRGAPQRLGGVCLRKQAALEIYLRNHRNGGRTRKTAPSESFKDVPSGKNKKKHQKCSKNFIDHIKNKTLSRKAELRNLKNRRQIKTVGNPSTSFST